MDIFDALNKNEIEFLRKYLPNINLDTVIEDGSVTLEFEELLEDLIIDKGFEKDYIINQIGLTGERIIDKLFDNGLW